ncbi:MAG: hypothetical protein J0M12_15235 [Deltaproteobacteria bacterium]|nr:hypothetical protein [Deltaproteobacteria bacterium]
MNRTASKSDKVEAIPLSVVLLAIGLALIPLVNRALFTPDAWWHIALGDAIRRAHSIPAEAYSFTASGRPIYCHWWLSDVIFSTVSQLCGLSGLEAFGFLLVIGLSVSVALLARELGASVLWMLVAQCLFFGTAQQFLILRPQLFSALFAVWIFILYLRSRAELRRSLFILPLFFVAWSNLHGGFLLGILELIGILCLEIGSAIERKGSWKRVWFFSGLLAICVLASFLNPYGSAAFRNAIQHDPFVQGANRHIDEWLSPTLLQARGFYLSILFAALLIAARRARPTAIEACVFISCTVAALLSWRHVMLFGIFAIPVLVAWASRSTRSIEVAALPRRAAIAIWLALLALVGWQVFYRRPVLQTEHIERSFPVRAAAWLGTHPQNGQMFHPYEWGGYLIYALRGTPPVYIDSRLSPYSEIFPDEYFTIFNLQSGWEDILERRSIRWMLVRNGSPLQEKLETTYGWKRIYSDDTAVLLRAPGS